MLTPEVRAAIDEIGACFPKSPPAAAPDGQGGAFVVMEGRELGPPYAQTDTWIGFHITQACPYADVYPHFVHGDLTRADGADFCAALQRGPVFPPPGAPVGTAMLARPAIQVSRRSNRRDASGFETPLLKLLKVLQWLEAR